MVFTSVEPGLRTTNNFFPLPVKIVFQIRRIMKDPPSGQNLQ